MIRSKFGLLGLCAVVFGVMAFSASAAQASGKWLILNAAGTITKNATELPATIGASIENNDASLLTEINKGKVKILCTAGTLTSATLAEPGKVSEGAKVKFTGCKIYLKEVESKPCEPKSKGEAFGTIATEKGHALIVLHVLTVGGAKDEVVEILPDNVGGLPSELFATIEVGELCSLPASIPIKGKLFVKECKNEFLVHKVTHLIEELKELTHLYAISDTVEHAATLDGSANVFLTGIHEGSAFAGHAN